MAAASATSTPLDLPPPEPFPWDDLFAAVTPEFFQLFPRYIEVGLCDVSPPSCLPFPARACLCSLSLLLTLYVVL
jgi:hypothetical protein